MPPLSKATALSFTKTGFGPHSDVVAIDVGGQIFQTTRQTLTQSGSKPLLSLVSNREETRFIDRDPDLFSVLLSLLRTGALPSKARAFDLDDLIAESRFYGVEHLLIAALSDPSLLEAFNLERSVLLPLSGRDSPAAISATPFGTLHVSHGSKITSFNWSLRRKHTILTEFPAVDSLLAISPSLAAIGATDFSGLQVVDLEKGFVRESLVWENVTRSGSTVQAIGASPELLFSSFESGRRNSSCIMAYDKGSFLPVAEIGHSEIFGADLGAAIPAGKLEWVESYGFLMAAGSHGGPSGFLGNVKLWDVRSGEAVWEFKEVVDCFSDIAVSESLSAIVKVGVNSGEVSYADFRKLGGGEGYTPWVGLGEKRRSVASGKKEGIKCRIASHGSQVFVSRGGDIELWSEVMMGNLSKREGGLPERVFKKNLMGRATDIGGSRITNMGFGGNKMFVTRSDQQSIEVWQSPVKGF